MRRSTSSRCITRSLVMALLCSGLCWSLCAHATAPVGPGVYTARYLAPLLYQGISACSPDGTLLAMSQGFNSISLYRTADGTLVHTLYGHNQVVKGLAFTPDGQILISGGAGGDIRFWRMADGVCTRIWSQDSLTALALSPDGQTLATASNDHSILLWQVSDATLLHTLVGHDESPNKLAFSPDGLLLASCDDNATTKLWKVNDGACLQTLAGVSWVSFSPDSQTLATTCTDNAVRLRRTSDGTLQNTFTYKCGGYPAEFSRDGQYIISASPYSELSLWRVSDGSVQHIFPSATSVMSVVLLPDGNTLAARSYGNIVRVFQIDNGTLLQKFRGVNYGTGISPNGQIRVITSYSNSDHITNLSFYRIIDGGLISTIATGDFTASVFSPDSSLFATGYNNSIRVWRINDGVRLLAASSGIMSAPKLAFSPDGNLITVQDDLYYQLELFRVSDGRRVQVPVVNGESLSQLAFSPDGTLLAAACQNYPAHAMRIWSTSDGTLVRTITGDTAGIKGLAYTLDGQQLVSGSFDSVIKYWQISDGACLRSINAAPAHIYALAFSPDGTTLAVNDDLGTITFRNTVNDQIRYIQHGLAIPVDTMSYLSDGRGLFTSSAEGQAIWRTLDSQPDLQIRRLADAGYTGASIHNNDAAQTVTGTTYGGSACYAIKLVNDGTEEEQYQLTGTAGGPGWTVRYFDALVGGNEITLQLTLDPGWAVRLDPGTSYTFRAEVIPDDSVVNGATSALRVLATGLQLTDAVQAVSTKQPLIITVNLAVAPTAPQLPNTPLTLTANATTNGTGLLEYKFRAGYQDATGWHWSDLTNYQTTTTCTWTPISARLYTLLVYARELGSAKVYNALGTVSYRIVPPLSSVSVSVTPHTPQVLGTPITITATPTGGANLEYLFKAGYQDAAGWHWSILRDYASAASYTWTATVPHLYTILIYAREVGNPAAYQKYAIFDYRISAPAITVATLNTAPATPQKVNTPITLTAGATGGYAVEYLFKAGYQDASGWHWTELTGYQTSTTCTWTPTSARTYTLLVYAREVGSTIGYQKYTTVVYRVTP